MRKVFDAYAVLCWMQGEPGSRCVELLLAEAERGRVEILISAVNLGEVYYRLLKAGNSEAASSFLADAQGKVFPWRVVPATNRRVWEAAALKGRHSISYADAFAMALAKEFSGEIVTRDPEIIDAAPREQLSVDQMSED